MKKKLISSLLAVSLVAVTLMGCGGGSVGENAGTQDQTSQTEESTTADAETEESGSETSKYQTTFGSKQFDGTTIKVELWDRENSPEGSTITDNKWTKYIQEKMGAVGINVEFVSVPRGDEVTWMQSAMAGGTAPDIVLTYSYSTVQDYFQQGGVWDLSEFIDGEDQALNIKSYIGEDVINYGRLTGGNELCGIIARRASTARTNFFVRKDWMDELSLSTPTTVDELYSFVETMVKDNPDGRTDVLGTSFWDDGYLLGAFSKLATDPLESKISSKLTRDYYDEGMKELYKFKNKLYNNGLMDQEYYTRSDDDFISLVVNGRYATFEDFIIGELDLAKGSKLATLQENDPSADLVSIAPLKNIWDGKQYSTVYSSGGLIAFCPKTADAETVEACMTYLDWLCTEEGGFVISHGFEGEHYNMEDGAPVAIDGTYNAADKDWIVQDLFIVGNGGYYTDDETFSKGMSHKYPGYEDRVLTDYENALMGDHIEDIDDSLYTSPSETELSADIQLIKDEWIVKMITCPEEEFEANYESYRNALKDAGVETIEQERREHFTK